MRALFFLKTFIILTLFTALSLCQNDNRLIEFDYAQFGYDSLSNYVELYYSFNQSVLTVLNGGSAHYISAKLAVQIEDTASHQKVLDKVWKVKHDIDTNGTLNSLVGVIGFLIPKGHYKLYVTGTDSATGKSRFIEESMSVKPFIGEHLGISDIQLASKIVQDSPNKSSIFYKNSLEIIPIPTSVFGEGQPVVFFYCELYNLLKDKSENTLKFNYRVFNSKGSVVSNKEKLLAKSIDSRVELGSVVINKFPTDSYTLVVTLLDTANNIGTSSAKKFYIFNPEVQKTDTAVDKSNTSLASEFGSMSEEELDDLFNKSKYIAAGSEIDRYEALTTVEGKREFLYNFWKSRDADPSTPRNDYYQDYLKRVQIANQRFTAMARPGWKSDRGRIYLTYGEPNEIERFPNQLDTKPYEIWHYNDLEGGVIFIFADITGFSSYQLIHSTLRGELRDDEWQRRIETY
ncbi:MAG TPA: GWxTD domain-containing protein [Ignavibacteriaceae bacterium]|nr:GWxTD domain-containing protein [Ignavibacteriaceae bacterium]